MATKELRIAYNAPSTRQAIARAIRTEIEGGDQILQAEKEAHGRVNREGLFVTRVTEVGGKIVKVKDLTPAAIQLQSAREHRVEAESIIRQRWGMPPATGQAKHRA